MIPILHSRWFRVLPALVVAGILPVAAPAQDAAAAQQAAEARLREALKNSTLQVRNLETERATLQAAQAENEAKLKELSARIEAVTQRAEEDRRFAADAESALHAKLAAKEKEAELLKENLEKWKQSQQKAVAFGAAKEKERAELAQKVIVQQRRIDEQQVKNVALTELANEILDRYAKFGLGTALTAREPFTGITRVKLQSLMEDYTDKIQDQKIKLPPAEALSKTPEPKKSR